ncbi:hypothetical protein D3C75_186860 [compost metagenome]
MNEMVKNAKKEFELLDTLYKQFGEFDGMKVTTENRQKLLKLIRSYVGAGILFRQDEGSTVNLYVGTTRYELGMAPDISVTNNSNQFSLCLDGLQGTVFGAYEHYNELKDQMHNY